MNAERKPALPMDSRETVSIRVEPALWQRISDAALARSSQPSTFARDLMSIGLSVVEDPAVCEAYIRATAAGRAASVAGRA